VVISIDLEGWKSRDVKVPKKFMKYQGNVPLQKHGAEALTDLSDRPQLGLEDLTCSHRMEQVGLPHGTNVEMKQSTLLWLPCTNDGRYS